MVPGIECVVYGFEISPYSGSVKEAMNLQKKSFADAWEGKFGTLEYEAVMDEKRDVAITVDWENGTEDVLSGAEIYKIIFESNKPWMLYFL